MIQIHRAGHYFDFGAAQREAYEGYVAERRNFPTERLQEEVQNYEGKSRVGKLLFRIFSDEDALRRVKASKQVLEERAA